MVTAVYMDEETIVKLDPDTPEENMRQMIDFMRGMDPEEFDMLRYFKPCGTPSCIAGWTVFFYREYGTPPPGERSCFESAQTLLGLNDENAEKLFTPCGRLYERPLGIMTYQEMRFVTPPLVADVMENYLNTGEITWPPVWTWLPEPEPEFEGEICGD